MVYYECFPKNIDFSIVIRIKKLFPFQFSDNIFVESDF